MVSGWTVRFIIACIMICELSCGHGLCIIGSTISLGFYYSRDQKSVTIRVNFSFPPSSYVIIIIWNAIIYILHELLANRTNFFAERGGEHHDLFAVRCAAENFLHIFAHIWNEKVWRVRI